MQSLTVIVPFFNEEKNLPKLIEEINELPLNLISHLIFVDDGSTDGSYDTLRPLLTQLTFPTLLIRKKNGGKSSAIKEAIPHLKTTHAVILDADLELNPQEIPKLWDIVTSDISDIVFGYREFLSQSSFTYRYARGNRLISHFYGILFNEVITDVMCGFKLLPTTIWRELRFAFAKFAIEVEIPILMWKKGLRPYEVKVEYRPRSRSQGKIIGVRDAIQIFTILIMQRTIRIIDRR